MHWHWAMVVIFSTGYSPRHSLQDTSGSRARSQVGRHRAVVMVEQSEMREAQAIRHLWPPPEPRQGSLLAETGALGGGQVNTEGPGVLESSSGSSEKF